MLLEETSNIHESMNERNNEVERVLQVVKLELCSQKYYHAHAYQPTPTCHSLAITLLWVVQVSITSPSKSIIK